MIVVFGGGGLGREYAAIARSCRWSIGGFVDIVPCVPGVDVVCLEQDAHQVLPTRFVNRLGEPDYVPLVAIGTPSVLQRTAAKVRTLRGARFTNIIHPTACLLERVSLGDANVIYPGAILTTNIEVGSFNCISNNVSIGHDVRIGDCNVITPGANISGCCTIGNGVLIGTGANLLPGVTVGDGARIGAGAVVTKDVAPGATVVGMPAKAKG